MCTEQSPKESDDTRVCVNLLALELFFFNFNTPFIRNVNNTGTKYGRIMKQTEF